MVAYRIVRARLRADIGTEADVNGDAWTREEIALLVETYDQHLSMEALANRLGRTVAAVEAKAGRLGLRPADRPGASRR